MDCNLKAVDQLFDNYLSQCCEWVAKEGDLATMITFCLSGYKSFLLLACLVIVYNSVANRDL